MTSQPGSTPHLIWLLAYDGIQALDLTGPHEVFAAANRVLAHRSRPAGYRLHVVAPEGVSVTTESGLQIGTAPLPSLDVPAPHTLLIAGGEGALDFNDPTADLLSWVTTVGARSTRVACVCTGAFIAAEAGLLDGLRVTTHWRRAGELARRFPGLAIDPDAIFIRDGRFWTSAGVTAGIDLALALVETDYGIDIAQDVARSLVVFLRRAGGQSQFASGIWTRRSPEGPVRLAQELVERDPGAVDSVEALAIEVGLSSRQLTRRFHAEIGESPARFIEGVRIAAARQQLEVTSDGVAIIARCCGFGTAETLRRAFLRRLGVTPDLYRKRFTTKDTVCT